MAEPASTLQGTLIVAAAGLSVVPGLDTAMVLGAFAGSVVFVLADEDISTAKKLGYLIVAFIAGLILAGFVSSLLTAVLAKLIAVDLAINHGVGALLASTLTVKNLRWLLARDIGQLANIFRGKAP